MKQFFLYFFILIWVHFTIGKHIWTIDKVQAEVVSDSHKENKRKCFVSGADTSPCVLGGQETLTLRFNVKRASKQMRPHQAMLLVGYPEKELENAHIISVNTRGEATLTLKHKNIPLQLLFEDSPLLLTIVIGSFDTADPLLYTLGRLQIVDIDAKFDPPEPPLRYGPLPEIEHIFSPEQKSSSKILVIIFSIAILSVFGQLCKAWKTIFFTAQTPSSLLNRLSPPYILFFALLCATEVLLYMYWTWIRFPHVLIGLSVLFPLLIFSCKHLLSQIQKNINSVKQ
ncbi:uncharacterized protein T551_01777 [Pneumocystis jirovecii RU7]|uniref:Ribophorin II C-terminal domain-containing protein n=1 Tax=Pneumocystis jirovecii (strain RU7) TaxID=1408657 RepID=A0A0W4ZQ61_PNEJ7|nr:uncharacterized protein T551_01777 [Pneumocystis jirovecii RU7]KTW30494.1 hypothetical protein T551_01777 [Pneumocystis jirovecii RU7]